MSTVMTSIWMAVAMAWTAGQVPESNIVPLPVASDPTISFRLWFRVGSQHDPAGKEGLAALTAAMLTEASTEQDPYERILERLYPMAAGYASSTNVEMTVISGRVHRDNLNEYYPLLVQAVLSPTFQQADLDRLKSDVLNYLENTLRYASDEELGKAVLYQEIFAGTPYGHLPAGTVAAIKSITLDDIRNFYRTHYTRDNVVIGLGGGYGADLVTRLRTDLGRLPPGTPGPVPPPAPRAIEGLRVTIVEKDANATAISLGYPIDLLRGQPDWYALALANSWLGEHRNSSSHLFQVIRDQRGLNYGDYSYLEHFPNGGSRTKPPQNVCRRQQLFEIWIRPVPNETRHFALRAALRELQSLVDNGLSDEQFELTRKFLRNYVLHYAPTTSERLGYALDDRFYGISGSHLDLFRRRMEEVTRAEVNAAVKQYLQYGNLHVVFVTPDAEGLKQALVSDAPSPITYATPKSETILAEDRQISTFPLKIQPDAVKIIPVGQLFEK
jgi:zinc protease